MTTKTKSKTRQARKTGAIKAKADRQKNGRHNGHLVISGHQSTGRLTAADWAKWAQYLSRRKKPKPIERLYDVPQPPSLLWSISLEAANSTLMKWIEKCSTARRDWRLEDFDDEMLDVILKKTAGNRLSSHQPDLEFAADEALFMVGIASLLPGLAACAGRESWSELLDRLIAVAATDSGKDFISSRHDTDPWTKQLLSIELPLTLAYALPEIPGCAELGRPAVKQMENQLEELLDGDGWLSAEHVEMWRPLLAGWTRSWHLIKALKLKSLCRDSQIQWEWMLRQSMRMMRPDGSQMLAEPEVNSWCQPLFETALKTSLDRDDRKIAECVLPDRGKSSAKCPFDADETSVSEWAGLGALISHWNTKRPKVAVAIRHNEFKFEICCGKTLVNGTRQPEILSDGRPMALIGDWEVVCNYADEDVDYLELEIRLENDFRLQRQILLAREDEFLLISDIVLGTSCQRIDYRLELELPSYMSAVPETETTEVYLSDNKIRALVVPLALPEWRDARTDDRLSFREHRLELCQSTLAKNLYAGIFLDLNAKRSKKPRTWRKLTVAEQLEIVSAETAVAFRVQVGNGHWLIYRALDSVGNRSFIGQNHSCEFFVGRFRPDGDADELLSIE